MTERKRCITIYICAFCAYCIPLILSDHILVQSSELERLPEGIDLYMTIILKYVAPID